MGYRLVQAVLVVTVGRLGDMFGRVRIYNSGFVVFTVASILLSFDPFTGGHGALWLIGWRLLQAVGGSMLMANSAAILTDAFPAEQRGFALGTNQVAGLAGMFVGLVAGGLLAAIDWRWVFWVNVPVGVYGTIWAYLRLRDNGERHPARIDWWGNITFAVGLSAVLIAVAYGIQPYGGHTMGWTNPWVLAGLTGGSALLAAFAILETRIEAPMFQLSLFRIRAFTTGNLAGLAVAIARSGLQFMLIIWLQGIWLPPRLPPQPTGTQLTGTQLTGSADRKARGQAPGLPAGLARRLRRTGDQRRLPAGRLGGVPGAPGQRGVPGGVRRGDQQAAEHGQVLQEFDPLLRLVRFLLGLPEAVPGRGGRH